MRFSRRVFPLFAALLALGNGDAVEIRIATYNVRLGLGTGGDLERDSAEAVIARVDPDVIGLQEVYSADRSGNPSNLDDLAASLNYPHVFIPSSAIDTQSRVVILSKFPFLNSWSILSPAGENDMTRAASAVLIDLPGTDADPVIVNAHLKCCLEPDDSFRRAVEMHRINNFLIDEGFDSSDNIFFLGDFNLIGSSWTYDSLPAGLPVSYQLGTDVSFPVNYSPDPASYFTSLALTNPGFLQQNGSSSATHNSGSTLDYILISNPIAIRGTQTEIYKSSLDASFPGLSKSGTPLPASTSNDASDHYLVFGDFDIDGGENLSMSLSTNTATESSPPISLTITLPQPPGIGETVTVTITSSDSSEITPEATSLVFTSGQSSASTTLTTRPDLLLDGSQSVDIQASASGFNSVFETITVADSDTSIYELNEINSPWLQTFEGFQGEQTPAAWNITNNNWQGPDDGTMEMRGPRSYGGSSLGNFSGSENLFTATFQNLTGSTIKSLSVSYLAQQWRSFQNGSVDQWIVTFIDNGVRTEIPDLTFTSETNQASGALEPPLEKTLQGLITGLNIPPGASIQLEFQASPGTPGGSESDDVFINEIHYDNDSLDVGEFVEIVVGPGYSNDLSSIELVLYNGNSGRTYNSTRTLDNFMQGTICDSCHHIFYSEISGIQNGAPDGMALIVDGVVKQFISYEGSFTATNGPASGTTSNDIGVSQTLSTQPGMDSLGLTGDGSEAIDFTWNVLSGVHTPGQPNPGQSFSAGSAPQGIAIDNLILIPYSQSNETNPSSISAIDLITPDTVRLTIPTSNGFDYSLESSSDLITWTSRANQSGDGEIWMPDFPYEVNQFFRLNISPSN